jgi:hypothetical protein
MLFWRKLVSGQAYFGAKLVSAQSLFRRKAYFGAKLVSAQAFIADNGREPARR